ncbi:hypothetical protein [Dawidia cretensis]|nr:hypothetical protein [Dawidia cretensis]
MNVDLYKAVVTDTEDPSYRMEFAVTRDGFAVMPGDATSSGTIATNMAFEPPSATNNTYDAKVMNGGYPKGNGTEALKLTQKGSEVMHAEPNANAVAMNKATGDDYRTQAGVASGVMVHVGGNFTKKGNPALAASEGCFGVCNTGNSKTDPSNATTNNVMRSVINQAAKSKTNPGRIGVKIEKRDKTKIPDKVKVN